MPHIPQLGFGLGLRPQHYKHICDHRPAVDWFEVISENFMDTDGLPRRNLARVAQHYPLVMHGVALSIGSTDPLNRDYLRKLKQLAHDIAPAWISDHLCWTGIAHKNTHDLLPVPYTHQSLRHIVERITQVQDFLQRPIALENPSTYLEFADSHMSESEFIAQMARQSGCQLLLDVNNVYVTCFNHKLDPVAYIDALPLERVVQIHLAGHRHLGTHIIDTHDDHVTDDVWALYRYVVQKAGRVPNTMVEWDDNIPDFDILHAELLKAKAHAAQAYTPLAQLQTTMQQAILTGNVDDCAWIRPKEHLAAAAQLNVYVQAYKMRLHEAVVGDYTALQHYLGADKFAQVLDNFMANVPSLHFNIGRHAAQLPAFLASHADAFAVELAQFENALVQLADAAETTPLTPQHLAGITPDVFMQMVLHPRAALQLFAFMYPVNAYFAAVIAGETPAPPVPQASYVAVFRHNDTMWRLDLNATEYAILSALFSGNTIGNALAGLDESAATHLTAYFSRWLHGGLLTHIERITL